MTDETVSGANSGAATRRPAGGFLFRPAVVTSMGRFRVYRADVESPRLARVMAKVPGVAVAGDDGAVRATDDGTAPQTAPEGSGDDRSEERRVGKECRL